MGLKCETIRARDGHLLPVLTIGERRRHLGSCYDGKLAARTWLDGHVSERTENLILFGMGDCQIILGAMERIPGYIIVFEPEEKVYKEMRSSALCKKIVKSSKVFLCYGENSYDELGLMIKNVLDEDWVERTMLEIHPGYQGLYKEQHERLNGICQYVCDDITFMRAPLKRFMKAMIHNQITNIPNMRGVIPIARLAKGWNRDIPVILVSAGPSLEKNVEQLKRLHGRALIFCADAALPTLLRRDIIPDLVGGVDATKLMNCFADERSYHIPLLVTTNSAPGLLKNGTEKKIWGYDHELVLMLMKEAGIELPQVPFYLGVSTALYAILTELKAKTIIFIGQDLAYSEEGKSHVTGRDEGFIKNEKYKAEGYYGGEVWSRMDWIEFKNWFEKMIQLYPDCDVINATEGGVHIRGTRQQTLKSVVDSLAEVDNQFLELLHDEKYAVSDEEYEQLIKGLYQCGEDLRKVQEWGYHKTFFEEDYRQMPVMRLVIEYMKILDDEREVRFEKALEFVKDKLEQGGWME